MTEKTNKKKKKRINDLQGIQRFESMKDYLKTLENTMGKLHNETVKKVVNGRK